MKEILLVGILSCFALVGVVLAVLGRIGKALASFFLALSIAGSWVVVCPQALQNVLDYMFAGGQGVSESRSGPTALKETDGTVESQPVDAKPLSDEHASPLQDTLSSALKKTEQELTDQTHKLQEALEGIQQLREETMRLRVEASELGRLMTRIVWLQVAMRDRGDSEREVIAHEQILDLLDEIVNLTIADPEERAKFVNDVKGSFPANR